MFLIGRRFLGKADKQSDQSCKDLEKTYDIIIDAIGRTSDYDDNGLLIQILKTVDECSKMMTQVSDSLTVISARPIDVSVILKERPYVQKEKNRFDEENETDPLNVSAKRTIQKAVEQSSTTYEGLNKLFELVLLSLGSAGNIGDKELLYQDLKTIETCRDSLSFVSSSLSEINKRLEQIELEVLYGPPSFFGDE